HGADLSRGSRDELRDPGRAPRREQGFGRDSESRPGRPGGDRMSPRGYTPMATQVPILIRPPELAPDPRPGSPSERSNSRHAPVSAFERVMLLAGTSWVVALTFVRWPAPLYSPF